MKNKLIVALCVLAVMIGSGVFYIFMKSASTSPKLKRGITDIAVTPAAENTAYSLSDVSKHNSAASCYSIINGKVYDLTSWIGQHPGGPQRILMICGKDGSSLFNAQHSGQSRPENELANYYIARLEQ